MLQVFEADLFFGVGLWELYRLQHPIHCLCLELLVCCVRFCVICSLWQVTNLPLTGAVVLCLEICADPRDMLCQLRCAGHRDSKRRDDCGRLQFQSPPNYRWADTLFRSRVLSGFGAFSGELQKPCQVGSGFLNTWRNIEACDLLTVVKHCPPGR